MTTAAAPVLIIPLPSTAERGTPHRVPDEGGGLPLRCCLRDSRGGEEVDVVSVTPEGPLGAYRESGPVFVHAADCGGPVGIGYPEEFRTRDQVFRAYGEDGSIVDAVLVPAGAEQEDAAQVLLRRPDVDFVQSRNVRYGCYMFTMRLAQRG